MKKLFFIPLLIVLAAVLVLVGCTAQTPTPAPPSPAPPSPAPPAETITLIYSDYQPAPPFPLTAVMTDWTKKITAATDGRVQFEYFYGGTLIAGAEALVELKKGTADITQIPSQLLASDFPLSQLSQKCFYGIQTLEDDIAVYNELTQQVPELGKEWSAVKPLVSHDPGPQHLQSTKAVRSLEDFKGLKVRTPGPWLKDTLTTLGASVISVPPTEVYISLQKGIIDADMHPMEFLQSFKTGELEKYTTLINIFDSPAARWCMNWDSFNNLPPDIQKVIEDSLPQAQDDMITKINAINDEALAWCLTLGPHEVITLPAADLERFFSLAEDEAIATAKAVDEKGLPGTKLYQTTRDLINDLYK